MYQALLTRRYLTHRIMPLLAAVAVLLCTATELIVWSVMGGFLKTLVDAGRELSGDATIAWPLTGFGHYEDLIQRLEADPAIEAAAPIVETFGLVLLPDGRPTHVNVRGVEPASYARATNYARSLHWRPLDKPVPQDSERADPRLDPLWWRGDENLWPRLLDDGLRLFEPSRDGRARPAIVPGIEVSNFARREPGNWYAPIVRSKRRPDGSREHIETFLPEDEVTLSVLPLDSKGRNVDFAARRFPVANEFRTGAYEVDRRTVIVEIGALQDMLKMGASHRVEPGSVFSVEVGPDGQERFAEPKVVEEQPARATAVLVRARDRSAPGVEAARRRMEAVYAEFAADHDDAPGEHSIQISTWEEDNALYIGAVKKEIVLVMFIFGIISLTSVFLVLAIFWAMVSEKTRDVGVLRAIGASRSGIAWLWLRYGLSIGLVGAVFGVAAAYAIVININPIHDWLGKTLNIYVWDPRVYMFTTIPNEVETWKASVVFGAGVVASVLGALWPAVRAARMDPVRALRFE